MSKPATGTARFHRGRWQVGIRVAGSRTWHDVPGLEPVDDAAHKARARAYGAWLSAEMRSGRVVFDKKAPEPEPAGETFEAWCERWLAARAARHVASVKDDRSRLRTHVWPTLGARPVAAITTEDLERLVQQLDQRIHAGTLAWRTARNVWAVVARAFADAKRSKDLSLRCRKDNPAADVVPPDAGVKKAKTYLYPSEVAAVLACDDVPVRWKRLLVLSVYLYVRAGELEALEWEDLDLERGIVHVHRSVDRYRDIGKVTSTKGDEARRFPIEPALLPLLVAMRHEVGGRGRVVKMPPAEDLADRLRTYLRWSGVERADLHAGDATRKRIAWHDLRATGITWRAVRGDDPLKIQAAAGHKDFSTTQRYIREAEALREGFGQVFEPIPAFLLDPASGSPQPEQGGSEPEDR